jgi:C-terminal processing protease CtpA/Prc
MKNIKRILITLLVIACFQGQADTTSHFPKFDEVYKLLQENAGMTREQLDAAVVRGLMTELKSQVSIVDTNSSSTNRTVTTNGLSKAMIYEKSFGYFRIGEVSNDLNEKLAKQYEQLSSSNKIKGLVLDLRFAHGDNYAAAAAVADRFLNSEQPLIDWGGGSVNSTLKNSPIAVPVAVLVNKQTSGAAEALAAILREVKVGLMIGSISAGQASIFKEFSLENGQKLRIAVSPIKVGKGKTLSFEGLKPDIEIRTDDDDEKAYFEDAYTVLSKPIASGKVSLDTNAVASVTNTPRSRLNEAELVRRHREGLSTDDEFIEKPVKGSDGEVRLINDPALARALDLLKGLAVVQQTRPL